MAAEPGDRKEPSAREPGPEAWRWKQGAESEASVTQDRAGCGVLKAAEPWWALVPGRWRGTGYNHRQCTAGPLAPTKVRRAVLPDLG